MSAVAGEWSAATVDQSEAEAGTATTRRAWTAERVRQAVAAGITASGSAIVSAINSALGGTTWQGGGSLEVENWAALQALTGVPDGRVYTVLAPVCTGGIPGTQWVRHGLIWRPAGRQTIYHTAVPVDGVSGGATTEQLLRSVTVPPLVLSGAPTISIRSKFAFSAADTNARTIRLRAGTAGTSADVQITGYSLANTQRQTVIPGVYVPISNTTIAPMAPSTQSANTPEVQTNSTGTYESTIFTLPDMSANSIVLSASVQQGASPTSTAACLFFQIVLGA